MKSCLYEGEVLHNRYSPKEHNFKYKLFLSYIDLDELDEVFSKSKFWSLEKLNFISFRRRDYHGDKSKPLKEEVFNTVEDKIGRRPNGPVRILTNLRFFGYCFNSVSFYYCYKEDGETLDALMAEIENTPWGERYCYVFDGEDVNDKSLKIKLDKKFHISPFFPMDIKYIWEFFVPSNSLRIHMTSLDKGSAVFYAGLQLKRVNISSRSLNRMLFKHPLMTFKMIFGIYFQALRLWMKRIPFFDHPNPDSRKSIISDKNKEGVL
ncbi:DUF1365 domain-containing protein [Halobacteriovorax sp. YZS-1-1]|uniref:DUF1365 domain-containing protein n=1 Tax=unclassified Halobacteriovorax TaxID=2639665 RepID=UPI00399BBC72